MNKISVFYEHICRAAEQSGKTVGQVLELAKQWGIELVEVNFNEINSDPEGIKKLLDSYGFGVSCVCADLDFINDSAEESAKKYNAVFRLTEYFGCENVLCIPGFFNNGSELAAQTERVCRMTDAMCRAAKKYGITVLIEDYDNALSPCCTSAQMKYIADNADGLRIAFDTGNFFYCRDDIAIAYEMLKDKIAHCHLKDRGTKPVPLAKEQSDMLGGPMYSLAVGDGELALDGWIKRLKEDGYDGIFVIEHFALDDQLAALRRSAAFVTAALEKS